MKEKLSKTYTNSLGLIYGLKLLPWSIPLGACRFSPFNFLTQINYTKNLPALSYFELNMVCMRAGLFFISGSYKFLSTHIIPFMEFKMFLLL